MAAVLSAGGVVVLPTDTVVGLAALPGDVAAVARLASLKGRPPEQPYAVLVADAAQGLGLFEDPDGVVRSWAAAFWPGPLTIIGRRAPAAAGFALGGDPSTIGVRCPDDERIRAVAASVGPIVATSANVHGQPTPTDPVAAASLLLGPVDHVVSDPGRLDLAGSVAADAGTALGAASTVVDATVTPWIVRRAGAIDEAALRRIADSLDGP